MKTNAKYENPFNPQFGVLPSLFIGRELIINDFIRSIGNPDDPNRTTIITGLRGSGKTAILSDIAAMANLKKNIVVDVSAHDGMLEEILSEAMYKGKRYLRNVLGEIRSFNVGALGFSFGFAKHDKDARYGFRHSLSFILDELAKHDIGLIVLIDEVNNGTPEMREFSIAYQHLIRENRGIYLMMAGLPRMVSDVLNDKVLTFLRRAHRVYLEHLDERLVVTELRRVFDSSGFDVNAELVEQIAKFTKGYPYLIQLIGYYLWRSGEISGNEISRAAERAKIDLFQNVHDIIWKELSPMDKEFLQAMSEDEEVSLFADILSRMAVDKRYASKYRERLLDAGIIKSMGYGKLIMLPPYIQEYIAQL